VKSVIVLGLGGMGSAAAWRLARSGARVLAFDPHPIGHALGSSHGEVRMIRQAYFEHPDYVPLLGRAYELWAELERESGRELFRRNGVIIYGPAEGGAILPGVLRSAERHSLPVERLEPTEALRRFPEYRPPAGFQAVLEPGAGWVWVETSVSAAAQAARAAGADLRSGERVLRWSADADGVEVTTGRASYRADRLVIAAGAWSGPLLGDVSVPGQSPLTLDVRRVVQVWLRTRSKRGPEGLPCFGFELPYGFMYGFPLEAGRMKVALHAPGAKIADPDAVDRQVRPADTELVERFARECLPECTGEILQTSVCMYTMSPDQHFIIDSHPSSPHAVFAAGFSGHGFKFAPVIGEILAELALHGKTRHPIGFLRRCR
jgi:monomeric sarcosine oxidase